MKAVSSSPQSKQQSRVRESALFLIEHIQDVPVHVIPCISGRTDGLPANRQASKWASVIPATWSFMLAARARGLGTAYTTFTLSYEKEVAELLRIPFEKVMQAGLIPVAYTKGIEFKPAERLPAERIIHWDRW